MFKIYILFPFPNPLILLFLVSESISRVLDPSNSINFLELVDYLEFYLWVLTSIVNLEAWIRIRIGEHIGDFEL